MITSRSAVCIVTLFTIALGTLVLARAGGKSDANPFPETVMSKLPGGERFKDPSYSNLMLGSGLQSTSSKVIFERLTAASNAKETYKALYLARIFTGLEPQLPGGWANRAALASALGLNSEASACEIRAKDNNSDIFVPLDVLPGHGLSVKPASLADWAAAMSLLADSVAAKSGDDAMVAVRDDISGIKVPAAEEVQQNDQELVELGLPPEGPWSAPAPLNVNQIAPNSFLLTKPEAMHYKTVHKGSMFGAMVMAGLAGMTAASNPAASTADSEAAGKLSAEASNVANNYVGGHYTKVVFTGDAAEPSSADDRPIATGKSHAVGIPVPILWASGRSNAPTYFGHWSAGTKPLVVEDAKGKKEDPKRRPKREGVHDLQYPRLAILCAINCSIPLSAMELMLSREDLAAIAPSLVNQVPDDLDTYRLAYSNNSLTLVPTNLKERWYIGFDSAGNAYEVNATAAGWLVPATSK